MTQAHPTVSLSSPRAHLPAPSTPDSLSQQPTPITPPPALSFSGSADLYYRAGLNHIPKGLTSFTRTANQFQLGMASVKVEHKTSKVDMVADLGFGPREQEYAYNDQGVAQAIKQLYISYELLSWLKLTGGTWMTHVGYEVTDASDNRNYSMSYLFTYGPFSHTGVKADLTFGKNSFMVGISNPTDFRTIPAGGQTNKDLIAQYSFAPDDNWKFYLNYVGGRDILDNKVHQYDFVLTSKITNLFSWGANGTLNNSSLATQKYTLSRTWWGSALYLNMDPASWLSLNLRGEYFSDQDAVKLPLSANVWETTFSVNLKKDSFTFIPEFRWDHASNSIFTQQNGQLARTDLSFLVAAIYSF